MPDGVPARIAAIAGCAVITGVGAVLNVVGECVGRALLVMGAGGVGLAAVMGARLAGADPIVVVDVDDAKLEKARQLGATQLVDGRETDVVEAVPEGVDWAIEAVGSAQTLQQCIACLRPGGTAIAVGLGRVGATFEVPINEIVQRQKRVVGSLYGSANPLVDLPRLFGLYLAGRLPLDELLGADYALEQVNEAYAALTQGAVGRAVVVPWPGSRPIRACATASAFVSRRRQRPRRRVRGAARRPSARAECRRRRRREHALNCRAFAVGDPDSNRGHHDFQSCRAAAESGRFAGSFAGFAMSGSVRIFSLCGPLRDEKATGGVCGRPFSWLARVHSAGRGTRHRDQRPALLDDLGARRRAKQNACPAAMKRPDDAPVGLFIPQPTAKCEKTRTLPLMAKPAKLPANRPDSAAADTTENRGVPVRVRGPTAKACNSVRVRAGVGGGLSACTWAASCATNSAPRPLAPPGHERDAVAQARIGRDPGHGTTTARPTAPCVSAAYASLTCSSA